MLPLIRVRWSYLWDSIKQLVYGWKSKSKWHRTLKGVGRVPSYVKVCTHIVSIILSSMYTFVQDTVLWQVFLYALVVIDTVERALLPGFILCSYQWMSVRRCIKPVRQTILAVTVSMRHIIRELITYCVTVVFSPR